MKAVRILCMYVCLVEVEVELGMLGAEGEDDGTKSGNGLTLRSLRHSRGSVVHLPSLEVRQPGTRDQESHSGSRRW